MMKLIPVSEHREAARILFELLLERPANACISHREMPTWEEHQAFVKRMTPGASKRAYGDWNLVEHEGNIVGATYVTQADEIGIAIFQRFKGAGLGATAVKLQMRAWGSDKVFANIAPGNKTSAGMFKRLGFRLVQHTFMLETP